jgi:hypothetical protein
MSSIGSLRYALAGFLHKILHLLVVYTLSYIKNSGHFVQPLKFISLQHSDILVIFDVVSLFTNVPVDRALQVIEGRLPTDHTLAERSPLQVEAIMELLEICLRVTYFQVAWPWAAHCPQWLVISSWSTLRNWPSRRQITNHRCGCMAQIGYKIPLATFTV